MSPAGARRDTRNMFREQRVDPRERLALPLRLNSGIEAMTRDISATGLFFEMDGEYVLQGELDFEMQVPGVRMKFTSRGEIVRIEHSNGKTGVAVRLINPKLEYVP
jgi:hypothetical protein